jgi:hypothetical protein
MAAQSNIRSSFAGVLFRLIIVIFCLKRLEIAERDGAGHDRRQKRL